MTAPDHDTVIVGAGFSGIGTAIALDKVGMGDYLVIDNADGPGGTYTEAGVADSELVPGHELMARLVSVR